MSALLQEENNPALMSREPALKNLPRAAFWSLLDQVLLSGAHFLVGIAVLRMSSKAGYGNYVLCWSVLLLLYGLQNALVNTQMTVRAAGLTPNACDLQRRKYFMMQLLLLVPCVATAVSIEIFNYWAPTSDDFRRVLAAATIAFIGVAFREFSRSSLLLELDTRAVFLVDLIYVLALSAAITACALWFPAGWLPYSAVVSLGLASSIASFKHLAKIRPRHLSWRVGLNTFHEQRSAASWSVGGVLVTHIQSQCYVYVIGLYIGVTVAADANAARLLLMPVSIALTSLQRTLYPHLVMQARRADRASITRLSRLLVFGVAGLIAAYTTLLIVLSHWIIENLFGAAYAASEYYIALFGLLTWAETTRSIFSMRRQAAQQFRSITILNALTAIVTLVGSYIAVRWFGARATIIAQIAGELLLAFLLWKSEIFEQNVVPSLSTNEHV